MAENDRGVWIYLFLSQEFSQPYSRYCPREEDLQRFIKEETPNEETRIDILRHILHCNECEEYVLRGASGDLDRSQKALLEEYLASKKQASLE